MHVYPACKKWPLRKTYESQKYKKSPIHENADENITCDFGDGDISRLGVANQTHVYKHTNIVGRSVSWIIVRRHHTSKVLIG